MIRTLAAAVLCAAVVTGAGRADDGPVLPVLKKPDVGDVVKHTATERVTVRSALKAQGKTQTKDEESRTTFVFTERVLEKPKGSKGPTRLERVYEKADVFSKGADVGLGLSGKTVLIEKKADGYQFTSGNQPLAGKARDFLAKEFRGEPEPLGERFLPGKPVAVGATWEPDVTEFAKRFGGGTGLTFDPTKVTATAKLTKVYQKDGRRFGVMTADVTLVPTRFDAGGTELPLDDGSKLTVRAEFDSCVDGSLVSGRSKVTTTGKLLARLESGTLTLTLTSTLTSAGEELEKKTPAP
jgi:hypothetical protein